MAKSSAMELLNEYNIDLIGLITTVSIILGAWLINRLARWYINRSLGDETDRKDVTRFSFLKNALSLLIFVIALGALIYTIPSLRAVAITLFAGAGILMAIIGFAAQSTFANIVSGIMIVISKPYRVGDTIKVGGTHFGDVIDITLRHTVIRDFENKHIIIPNATMGSETIVNYSISDARICEWVDFGISYDSDVDKAIDIVREEAEKHANLIDGRTGQEKAEGMDKVRVRLVDFGDSSVNLRAWCWASDYTNARRMHWDMNKSVKERFEAEGIEIPYPYRTLVYKKDMGEKQVDVKPADS